MTCLTRAWRRLIYHGMKLVDTVFLTAHRVKYGALRLCGPSVRRGCTVLPRRGSVPGRFCTYGDRHGPSTQTLFFLPGGGYVVGRIGDLDAALAALARDTGLFVIAYQYPLAPEHKFPAIHDTVRRALETACDQFRVPPGSLWLGGESEGGVLCLDLLAHAPSAVRGLFLWYTAPQMSVATKSSYLHQTLARNWLDYMYFQRAYLTHPIEAYSPRVTPLLGEFPPVPCLYFLDSADMLLDFQLEFARSLGADTVLRDARNGYMANWRDFREDIVSVQRFLDAHGSR